MHWKLIEPNTELYTYSYFTQDDVCRLCWSKSATKEIYSEYSEMIIENSIADIMKSILEIELYNTHLNKVCEKCCQELERIKDFKKFCQETDLKLRDILENVSETEKNICYEVPVVNAEQTYENIDNPDHIYEDLSIEENQQNIPGIKKKAKEKSKLKNSPTYCKTCSLNLESIEKFTHHNIKVHGIENDGTVFKCFGCSKRFKSKKARLGHEVNFCSGLKEGYRCEICQRFLPKRCIYETHLRDHAHNVSPDLPELLFKCRKCKETFKTNEMLRNHMLYVHEKEKSYICDVCGRVFIRRDYLYKHKLMHDGVKQHQCPHCDFKATQRSSLTVHIRKHTGERPYSCDICPQRCVSSSNLRAHHRRHLGEKKYECNICSKKFGYKLSLEEHISGVHMHSAAHACALCGALYSRRRGLRRHLAAKHQQHDKLPLTQTDTKVAKETEVIQYELKNENVLLLKHQDGDVYMV